MGSRIVFRPRPAYRGRVSRSSLPPYRSLRPVLCLVACLGCGERKWLEFGTLVNTEPNVPVEASVSGRTPSTGPEVPDAYGGVIPSALPAVPPAVPDIRQVSGQVIDFWGHPVPSVELEVDGRLVTSDTEGLFEVSDVSERYDISLVVQVNGEASEAYGWTFEGLTRRDPTLQVYRGLPIRRANLLVRGPTQDGGTPCGVVALGGKHGHATFKLYPELTVSMVWRGVDAPVDVHSLTWEPLEAGRCDLPVRYSSHTINRVVQVPGQVQELTIDAASGSAVVETNYVSGVVDSAVGGPLELSVFTRVTEGPTLPVANQNVELDDADAAGAGFTLPVPRLSGASVTVAASRGGLGDGGYTVAYETWSPENEEPMVLTLPSLPLLETPEVDAAVPLERAPFAWRTDAEVAILAVAADDGFWGRFVVTSEQRAVLRDLSHLGMPAPPAGESAWSVEAYGGFRDVDEFTAAGGSLDPFSTDFRVPVGSRVGRGSLARSIPRGLSEAP